MKTKNKKQNTKRETQDKNRNTTQKGFKQIKLNPEEEYKKNYISYLRNINLQNFKTKAIQINKTEIKDYKNNKDVLDIFKDSENKYKVILKDTEIKSFKDFKKSFRVKQNTEFINFVVFEGENKKGQKENIFVPKKENIILKNSLMNRKLKTEKYTLNPAKIYLLTNQEKFLYFSLENYFSNNTEKLISQNDKNLKYLLEREKITQKEYSLLSFWLWDFINKNLCYDKIVSKTTIYPKLKTELKNKLTIKELEKFKKTNSYLSLSLINKKTISLFKKSKNNKEKFFKLLIKEFKIK